MTPLLAADDAPRVDPACIIHFIHTDLYSAILRRSGSASSIGAWRHDKGHGKQFRPILNQNTAPWRHRIVLAGPLPTAIKTPSNRNLASALKSYR